ncbi:hypothetical protein IEQ34_008205 [Dendrobium chrysotoxum]|uniref:Uncharacterized protein n=1 Tax=Dendrobium chrysotoxum TaxID=161865 RepID=A0AAV7H7Y3_DENCH|nr:hypothetical protein IEQ34_008205 [Dendrobium chrysotoxum]
MQTSPQPCTFMLSTSPTGIDPALNAQTKCRPLSSSPTVISFTCAALSFTSLLKATYTVEPCSCLSNQSSAACYPCSIEGGKSPIGMTGFS